MRCTRCDRPAIPQALGRAPDGCLVFGWCRSCLVEAGCLPAEGDAMPIAAPRPPLRRRARRAARAWARMHRSEASSGRRLGLIALAGGLGLWSIVLAAVGAVRRLTMPQPTDPRFEMADGTATVLLAGSGVMALASMGLWLAALDPPRRSAFRRGITAAIALGMAASLALGVAAGLPIPPPALLILGAVLFSWLLGTRSRGRPDGPRRPAAPAAR